MKQIYCPNCGYANDPRNRFCKRCGFNLMQYKQRMRVTARPNPASMGMNPNLQRGVQSRPPMPPRRHHTGLIVTIIVIIALTLAGFGTYETNVWPFGNGPLGAVVSPSHRSASQSNSSNTTNESNDNMSAKYTTVKHFWAHVNADVDSKTDQNSSSDYSDCFKNGSDNKAYKIMTKWCNMIRSANNDNGTTVESITPYDFGKVNSNKVSYRVRYDFKSGSHHHIQIYSWQTKVENGKLVSMTMKNHSRPVADYDRR